MFYYINQPCTPSFPIGLVKTKSYFIVRSVETGLGWWTLVVALVSVDAYSGICWCWGYRNRCFLVALCHLIVRRLNLEVATKRLLHRVLFCFFKILILWVVKGGAGRGGVGGAGRGVKGQKMVQNGKKLSLLRSISQESHIWFLFMVLLCKMIISPGVFFIFSKFWFFVLLEGSKDKKWPKMTKNFVLCTSYLRSQKPFIMWSWFIVHICKRIISLGVFYIFSKF